jgi:hypothetical protein
MGEVCFPPKADIESPADLDGQRGSCASGDDWRLGAKQRRCSDDKRQGCQSDSKGLEPGQYKINPAPCAPLFGTANVCPRSHILGG